MQAIFEGLMGSALIGITLCILCIFPFNLLSLLAISFIITTIIIYPIIFSFLNNGVINAEEMNNAYNDMINNSDQFYDAQKEAIEDYKNTQTDLQQQQTDFAIQKIEQEKDKTLKDYTKEQKGAYVDYQKASNQYGVNAEQMASQGLAGSGFSESSQVSMFNTYQNRVSTAREVYNQAILNYNNSKMRLDQFLLLNQE